MTKHYFAKTDEDEFAYSKQHHLDYMKENNIEEMEVYEAVVERGTGFFFCKEVQEVGEAKESCGKECKDYSPRNGKGGICKNYGYVYTWGKKITLKLK